jgi:hypothetical protein
MNNNSEISFYVDTLIVQSLLMDEGLSKTAEGSLVSDLIEKVKSYVGNHIDPNDKAGSVLNILAPGAVTMAFGAMGMPWIGILLGLAMRVFHIDVKGALNSIHSKISESVHSGKPLSSPEVDTIVNSAVQDHAPASSDAEAEQSLVELTKQKTSSQLLRDARMVKLAMIEFDHNNMQLQKSAVSMSDLKSFNAKKTVTSNILSRVIGWFFKIALASAGLMVAGDMINKFLGRSNALDGTIQGGKPVDSPAPAPVPVSKQTKFKQQPTYHEERKTEWVENVPNNKGSIESLLISFAKQVYQGLDTMDSVIRSSPSFELLADKIAFYNHTSEGDNMVFIPKYFTSKKQIVDMFIDEVAEKAP